MNIEQIMKEREKKELEIQEQYKRLDNYVSKLEFIYKLIETSQKYYLDWKGNNFLNDNYLKELKLKVRQTVFSDDDFIDFINDNLIEKISNDHVAIGPMEYDDLENDLEEKKQKSEDAREEFKNNNAEISFINDSAIIKIKSFNNTFIEEDEYIFKNLKNYLDNNEINNIIIDIRSNGGGSDAYFKHFSCFTDENLDFHDRLYDLFLKKELDFTWNPIPQGNNVKHYNKYLLINNEVFSTSETLAKFCKQTGYATIIGESTLGEGGGFTPFNIQLTSGVYNGKQSDKYKHEWKIIGRNMGLWFPTEAPINPEGKIQYEGYFNTKPDIECQSEETLQVALSLINRRIKTI